MINKYLSLLLSTRFMFFYLLSTRDINPTKSRGLNHTIGPGLETDDCYVQVVRSVMMRNIGARYPAILYEINKTLGVLLAGADEGAYQCVFPRRRTLKFAKTG